jgi:hypothetical protein
MPRWPSFLIYLYAYVYVINLPKIPVGAMEGFFRRTKTLANGASLVFNRNVKRLQRDRAAKNPNVSQFERLREEVGFWVVFHRSL